MSHVSITELEFVFGIQAAFLLLRSNKLQASLCVPENHLRSYFRGVLKYNISSTQKFIIFINYIVFIV